MRLGNHQGGLPISVHSTQGQHKKTKSFSHHYATGVANGNSQQPNRVNAQGINHFSTVGGNQGYHYNTAADATGGSGTWNNFGNPEQYRTQGSNGYSQNQEAIQIRDMSAEQARAKQATRVQAVEGLHFANPGKPQISQQLQHIISQQ